MMKQTNDQWNAQLYDNKHAFVFQYGQGVVELLAPQPGERILDLGCGTGHLTAQIAATGAVVTGIDYSPAMIAQARQSFPSVEFAVANGADFHFSQPFDAVFSNATLHWIKDKTAVIACVYRALKPGGRFVAEFGGKDNVLGIRRAIIKVLQQQGFEGQATEGPWYFPSLGEYAGLLEHQGFRVTLAAHFDRETLLEDKENGIVDWLDMFGKSFFDRIPPEDKRAVLQQVQQELMPTHYRDGRWYADYVRLRIVAIKV